MVKLLGVLVVGAFLFGIYDIIDNSAKFTEGLEKHVLESSQR